jgi:TatD DNase family protein
LARTRERGWPPAPEALPYPVVDNHTHLDSIGHVLGPDDEVPSVDRLIAEAAAVGVTRMVQVGCDVPAVRWTDALVRDRPELLGAIAIHPNEAPLHAGVRERGPDGLEATVRDHHAMPLDDAIALVADLARGNDRIRAIGETGLDLFRTGDAGRAAQRDSFRAHVALAKELGLALQIHDRDAHTEVLELLLADGAPERTVFHCYSGDAEMARTCVEQGWYLSFAGPVTFRPNDGLRDALREVPLSQVLVETDAPYLTPHPFRGRPNAPYLVPVTMATIAAVKDVSLEDACRGVAATSEDVYGTW